MQEIEKIALESIKKGSLSFSLASIFFSRQKRVAASGIYLWCRHCDDLFDEKRGSVEDLQELRTSTKAIWTDKNLELNIPLKAFKKVVQEFQIPKSYPLELINGMEMDLQGRVYENLRSLKIYCYRVASTVGLMMCHVMGLFEARALKNAAQLGMAMQLTNIARDVKTDFEMGRVYLPLSWLKHEGMCQNDYFEIENREKLFRVVTKLIEESEKLYAKGLLGAKCLPIRSALAVRIAARIYREIGREILKKGKLSLEGRTVVSSSKKALLILVATMEIAAEVPSRVLRPRKIIRIQESWTYL